MLLNHYTMGLELVFDYGKASKRRNDRKIRTLLREEPSVFSIAKLTCYEILNLILHTVFFLYVEYKKNYSKYANYKDFLFFDAAIENLKIEHLKRGGFMEYASDSMVRYLNGKK